MIRTATLAILATAGHLPSQTPPAKPKDFPGAASKWHGYVQHRFRLDLGDQVSCIVVAPASTRAGTPWVWRARFFGHEPQADIALLARGYHVVYCDVAGLFGSPAAVGRWDAFYTYLVEKHGFAAKPALEGMSRGGLAIYNWAAQNPEKVACIYGDAPVCDFKSWPGGKAGGKGKGKGSAPDWRKCLAAYGLDETSALAYRENPVDRLAPLAKAGIPILHVIGGADAVVPPAENSDVLADRYRKLGGTIHVVRKRGVGHHPHSLQNPRPIVEFVVGSCRASGADLSPADTTPFADNITLRGSLRNSWIQFTEKRRGHVAFLGGSITEMEGFRPMVCAGLRSRFPRTYFTFTNAGIASTCSTTGAFRLHTDVLQKGLVDLLFVEFAVNDDQDAGHDRAACIRGMEGIVRQARHDNPAVDIVFIHFVNPRMRDAYLRGETPPTVATHEMVATHYSIPSINLAREVADEIVRGEITWKTFGGTHPARPGNALTTRMVASLLGRSWASKTAPGASPSRDMPPPLEKTHFGRGGFVDPAAAKPRPMADGMPGWTLAVPEWSKLPGSKRGRFTKVPLLSATKPGATVELLFRGTAVGAYVLAGPDAGILEVEIDGKPYPPVDLFHRFSRGLHYPRTVMFATGLSATEHRLVLRVASAKPQRESAARILQFAVNAPHK